MKSEWFGKGLAIGLTSVAIAAVLMVNKPDNPEVYLAFAAPVLMTLFFCIGEY